MYDDATNTSVFENLIAFVRDEEFLHAKNETMQILAYGLDAKNLPRPKDEADIPLASALVKHLTKLLENSGYHSTVPTWAQNNTRLPKTLYLIPREFARCINTSEVFRHHNIIAPEDFLKPL